MAPNETVEPSTTNSSSSEALPRTTSAGIAPRKAPSVAEAATEIKLLRAKWDIVKDMDQGPYKTDRTLFIALTVISALTILVTSVVDFYSSLGCASAKDIALFIGNVGATGGLGLACQRILQVRASAFERVFGSIQD